MRTTTTVGACRRTVLLAIAAISCGTLGCAAATDDDERVGEAEQPQFDLSPQAWRKTTMTFVDSANTPFATVFVFTQAMYGYTTNTEYWFVNRNSLSELGSYALSMATTDYPSTVIPVDPGYANEQTFTQVQNVSWGTGWSTDPVSGGSLYAGPGNKWFRFKTSGSNVSDVTVYQTLLVGSTPANITPSGTYSVAGSSVTPSRGYVGFSIEQAAR